MELDEILARIERAATAHTTSGACDEGELRAIEAALGHPLPPPFRAFLARLGGGIFFGVHEIFGCHRVMIHDIELVPSLRAMRAALARQEPPLDPQLLAFHRAEGRLHAFDLAAPDMPVVAWPSRESRGGFAQFLETVVLRAAAG